MTKVKGFLISVISFIMGFILNGLAWTVLPGPELNTLALVGGLFLMASAFVLFIASFWMKD